MSPSALPTVAILTVILLGISAPYSVAASAQEHGRMLMVELEGNRYVRRDHGADGELEGQQRIEAGTVAEEGGRLVLPLSVEGRMRTYIDAVSFVSASTEELDSITEYLQASDDASE